MVAAATGLFLGAASSQLHWALPAFALAAMGIFAALPVFWTLPTAALAGTAAAGGIALINSIGTLSGYLGPVLMGRLKDHTGDYAAGLAVIGGGLLAAALLVLIPRLSPMMHPRH